MATIDEVQRSLEMDERLASNYEGTEHFISALYQAMSPEKSQRLGVCAYRDFGIIVVGPNDVGKSLLVRNLVEHHGAQSLGETDFLAFNRDGQGYRVYDAPHYPQREGKDWQDTVQNFMDHFRTSPSWPLGAIIHLNSDRYVSGPPAIIVANPRDALRYGTLPATARRDTSDFQNVHFMEIIKNDNARMMRPASVAKFVEMVRKPLDQMLDSIAAGTYDYRQHDYSLMH
jgi:hypothetical protein